jgi:hypothetical protein
MWHPGQPPQRCASLDIGSVKSPAAHILPHDLGVDVSRADRAAADAPRGPLHSQHSQPDQAVLGRRDGDPRADLGAAPVYIKFGLRNASDSYPSNSHLEATAIAVSREWVRRARLGLDLLARSGHSRRHPSRGARAGRPGRGTNSRLIPMINRGPGFATSRSRRSRSRPHPRRAATPGDPAPSPPPQASRWR